MNVSEPFNTPNLHYFLIRAFSSRLVLNLHVPSMYEDYTLEEAKKPIGGGSS